MEDTKIIETSKGNVTVRNSVTAREYRTIRAMYIDKIGAGDDALKKATGTVMNEIEDEVLSVTIQSIGEVTDKAEIVKLLGELTVDEYQNIWELSEKAVSLTPPVEKK
jgi:hypothetical protein